MIWIVGESQQQHLRHPIHLQIRNCVTPPALARTCPNKVTTCTPCCPTATCCTGAAAPGSGGTCHSQFASSFVFWPLKVYLQTGLWQRSVVSCHDGFQLFPLFRRARFPHLKTKDMLRKCEICPLPNYTGPGRPRRRSSASSIHDEVAGLRKLLFQRPPSDLAALCKLCACAAQSVASYQPYGRACCNSKSDLEAGLGAFHCNTRRQSTANHNHHAWISVHVPIRPMWVLPQSIFSPPHHPIKWERYRENSCARMTRTNPEVYQV